MRVTTQGTYLTNAANLERTAEQLAKWQQQVASGLRVQKPSDDPSAAAAGLREREQIAQQDQYESSADSATARLAVIDTVLSSIIDRLTEAKTTILSARGTTATPERRAAASDELRSLRDALAAAFNTSFQGTYLFGGSSGTTPPYTELPDGSIAANAIDQTPISVDIDRNIAVQITYGAAGVAQGSDPASVFQHLDSAIAAALAGNDAALQAAADGIEAAFDRATSTQSHVGASIRAVEVQHGRIGQLRRASEARITDLEGANLAEAISRMNQSDAAYRAALGAVANTSKTSLMDYL
jgi:flagellar hook-associated protein 3 FlgL